MLKKVAKWQKDWLTKHEEILKDLEESLENLVTQKIDHPVTKANPIKTQLEAFQSEGRFL